MKLTFFQADKSNWGNLQADVSKAIREYLNCGKDFFVQFGYDKPKKDPKIPNVFIFRQSNKDKRLSSRTI